jgi:hypothetical protein
MHGALSHNELPTSEFDFFCIRIDRAAGASEIPVHEKFQRLRNSGADVKLHFYVDSDDDAERCKESSQLRKPIAMCGTDTLTGRLKLYRGIVLSIETVSVESPGERFRVTMDDPG